MTNQNAVSIDPVGPPQASPQALLRRLGTLCILFCIYLAMIYVADPVDDAWGARHIPILKYMPSYLPYLVLPVFWLTIPWRAPLSKLAWGCMCGFFALMTIGSFLAVTRFGYTLDNSFVGRAMHMGVVFPTYWLFQDRIEGKFLLRWIWLPYLVVGAFITVGTAVWFFGWHFVDPGISHIYHEQILVPITGGVLAYFLIKRPAWRWTVTLFLLSAGFLSKKNTGYLLALLALSVIVLFIWNDMRKSTTISVIFKRFFIFIIGLLMTTTVLVAYIWFSDYMPHGSVNFRMVMYATRLAQFLESPLWGQFFILDANLVFGKLWVPSHSDWLDFLAGGGVFAFSLFLVSIAALLPKHWSTFAKRAWKPKPFTLFFFAVILVTCLEMMFNPIFGQNKIIWYFWLGMAYLMTKDAPDHEKSTGDIV